MKIVKKLINIVFIFVIIQALAMAFMNSKVYAEGDSFFERAFKESKEWDQMGESNSAQVLNNATNVTTAIEDIGNGVRVIGIAILVVYIAFLFISLAHNNGADIAHAKLKIGITFVLVLMFLFANQIMSFFTNFAQELENTM